MAQHNELGAWGESLAREALIAEGYAIRDTNWRMGHYEIDIIAERDAEIIFAEVKTRRDFDIDPLEAVDSRKIAHMIRSAEVYVQSFDLPHFIRFDLFGIRGTPEKYEMEHIKDAFEAPLTSY